MLVATVRIWLSKDQSVVRENVTPAEAAFYVAEHQHNYGKIPVEVVGEPKEVERSGVQEVKRLLSFLSPKKVKQLYPSATATLPADFDEAIELASGVEFASGKLVEHDLSKE